MAEGPKENRDKKKPWKETVIEVQQFYYEVFGDRDWDRYDESEMEFLERNVGHAVFGPPKELPDEKNGSTGTELLIDFLSDTSHCVFLYHKQMMYTVEHDTSLSHNTATCCSSHEPSSGTSYYSNVKQKYLLACSYSVSEFSLQN